MTQQLSNRERTNRHRKAMKTRARIFKLEEKIALRDTIIARQTDELVQMTDEIACWVLKIKRLNDTLTHITLPARDNNVEYFEECDA